MTDMGNQNFDQFKSGAQGGEHAQQPASQAPAQPTPAAPQANAQSAPAAPPKAAAEPAAKPAQQADAPAAAKTKEAPADNATQPIGVVLEVAGSGSQVAIDLQRLNECMADADPSIALAGQVGSQIKIRVGDSWLLASVRDQRKDRRANGGILANIDFLGEGVEEKLTGRLRGFRRGVTRYPVPGALIFPASTADLKQVYASDGRANVEIGTVYPTKDIRAGLYIDAMLGKHFALLGSTGTGKSTSAALILHRICQAAPEGHVVMVDPHGEYSAAFRQTGMILDVSNLQMPYWLMNFEEHCEVLLTSDGNERQVDADILAKCLLKARQKNRLAEHHGKITVDSPIPYSAVRPVELHPGRDGQARQGDLVCALYADQEQARRAQGRSALPVHVLGHACRRHHGRVHRQACSACRAMASRSRSSTFRAFRPT